MNTVEDIFQEYEFLKRNIKSKIIDRERINTPIIAINRMYDVVSGCPTTRNIHEHKVVNKINDRLGIENRIRCLSVKINVIEKALESIHKSGSDEYDILIKRYLEGMSVGEIAADYGISASTVRNKLHKAGKRLVVLVNHHLKALEYDF